MTETSGPMATIPHRLVAGEPGWTTSADVIVVGSGIAGLTTALRLRQRVDRVLLVTKTVLNEGSTQWAQGGIAAALDMVDVVEQGLFFDGAGAGDHSRFLPANLDDSGGCRIANGNDGFLGLKAAAGKLVGGGKGEHALNALDGV